MTRIVLLTGEAVNPFYQEVIAALCADPANQVVGVAVDARRTSLWSTVKKDLRRGRGGYVVVKALRRLLRPKEPTLPATALAERLGVPLVATDKPNSEATAQRLRELGPDVMVRAGAYGGIIKRSIIDVAPLGILSYHHGDIRRYRGGPPGFWEVYDGAACAGVTVQRLAEGLDCGPVIAEVSVPVLPTDSWRILLKRQYESSSELLAEGLRRLHDPDFEPGLVAELGPVNTEPDLTRWTALQGKVMARRARAALRRWFGA